MNWRKNQIISFQKILNEKENDIQKIEYLRNIYNNTMVQRKEIELDDFITNSLLDIQSINFDLKNKTIVDITSSFFK